MHSVAYAVVWCMSVCPTVCHICVLHQNEYTYPQSSFTIW